MRPLCCVCVGVCVCVCVNPHFQCKCISLCLDMSHQTMILKKGVFLALNVYGLHIKLSWAVYWHVWPHLLWRIFWLMCVCMSFPIAEQNWKLIFFAFPSQECLAVAQTRTFKKQFCKLKLISHSFQVILFNFLYWVCYWTWQHFQNRLCTPEKFSLLKIKTGNKLLMAGGCCSDDIKRPGTLLLCVRSTVSVKWITAQAKFFERLSWIQVQWHVTFQKIKCPKKMLGCYGFLLRWSEWWAYSYSLCHC